MSDTSMKPNQFNSVMDQDLSSPWLDLSWGQVCRIQDSECRGKFVQWSLVDTELAGSPELWEEFLNIITTLKGVTEWRLIHHCWN